MSIMSATCHTAHPARHRQSVYKTRPQSRSFPTPGKIKEDEEVPPGRMEDDVASRD